jgi:tRNA wybutosine-synthesizing protein 4
VISECVLCYLDPNYSESIIRWITSNVEKSMFFIFEQFNPKDKFGKKMVENLQNRKCPLLSIDAFPMLKSQVNRFLNLGFDESYFYNMLEVYHRFIESKELERIEKIEMFDEFEEWDLLLTHYCFGISFKNLKEEKEKSTWLKSWE